jgi:hypothetical protein
MARLSICLLGPIEVTLDRQLVTGLRSDKVRALLQSPLSCTSPAKACSSTAKATPGWT